MYNTLFGHNNMVGNCLFLINQDLSEIERFRDAIVKQNEDGKYVVEILTRTGGANKKSYPNILLHNNPNLYCTYDDEYDSTYEHYLFHVCEEYVDNVNWDKLLADQSRNSLNLKEMFEDTISKMDVPGTKENETAKKMAKGLERLIQGSSGGIVTVADLLKLGEDE